VRSRIAWIIVGVVVFCGLPIAFVIAWIRDSQTGHYRHPSHDDISFDLSPKGDEIAFSLPVEGGMDIYLYNIPLRKISRLLTSEKYEWAPRFSSDGSKIAFAGGVPGERGDHLFVLDRKSNKLEQLTKGLDNDTWPSFYDQDHKIVFTRETEYQWGGLTPNWHDAGKVHSLDLSTHEIKQIEDRSVYVTAPEVLRSGLLFVNDFQFIKTVDLKSKAQKVLVKECREARISVDEKSIVFTEGGLNDNYLIHVKSLVDGSVRGMIKWNQNPCSNPVLSPDGKWIYYIQNLHDSPKGPQLTMNRIGRDGKNPEELFNFAYAESLGKN
jgi:Tol biopolymer transport system component